MRLGSGIFRAICALGRLRDRTATEGSLGLQFVATGYTSTPSLPPPLRVRQALEAEVVVPPSFRALVTIGHRGATRLRSILGAPEIMGLCDLGQSVIFPH